MDTKVCALSLVCVTNVSMTKGYDSATADTQIQITIPILVIDGLFLVLSQIYLPPLLKKCKKFVFKETCYFKRFMKIKCTFFAKSL